MTIELGERAETMSPHATDKELDYLEIDLAQWIEDHASVIRQMGATRRTVASLSVTRSRGETCIECSFRNWQSDLYTVTITTGHPILLAGRTSQAPDPTAAMAAMAALLQELDLTATLE